MLAVLLSVSLPLSPALASTTPAPVTSEGLQKFSLAKQTELESILLLKNEARSGGGQKMLPLSLQTDRLAVFGRGQSVNVNGSSGSGTVAGAFTYTFLEGLQALQSSPPLYSAVATGGTWNTSVEYPGKWGVRQSSGTGWNMSSPIQTPENKYADAAVAAAAAEIDTAVVFLSRQVGTEEMDRASHPPQPSDWYLNPSELTMVAQVTNEFDNVVVVISTAGSLDMTWLDFSWMRDGSDDYYSVNGMYTGPKSGDVSSNAAKIKSIVWSYGGGSYYGLALAELLYGVESFSAKLADTITYDWYDHFTSNNFGGHQTYANNGAGIHFNNGADMGTINGLNDPIGVYQEYIYSGHRYFDTFMGNLPADRDPVLFPFGFGLTYADFRFDGMSVAYANDEVTVTATVTNRAGLTGKEVVEVYVSAPNDKRLDQPYQKLVGYAKTGELAAGESQTVTVAIPLYEFASYDEASAAYILEEGLYKVRVGNSSRHTDVAGALQVVNNGADIVVETLSGRLTLGQGGSEDNQALFDGVRLNSRTTRSVTLKSWNGGTRVVGVSSMAERGGDTDVQAVTITGADVSRADHSADEPDYIPGTAPDGKAYTLQAVKDGDIALRDFVAQLTTDELVAFLSGGVGSGPAQSYSDDAQVSLTANNNAAALSKPSASGARVTGAGSSRGLQRLGIPSLTYADGSAGISISQAIAANLGVDRNPGYARAAGMACTWNPELQYQWGVSIGKEMRAINVDVWLAPSVNLHRNPLNGRNTEYYSEDPFLSGAVAANAARGVAEQGVTVCLKHFAGNDQEQYRRGFHTPASVQAGASKDAYNTITSERALREVTLRPFEMAVKTDRVMAVMSAFNKINGQFCASSEDLLTHILRGEWGFRGFVVTDWGDYDEIAHAADEMRAGNDMIMSGVHTRYSIPAQIRNGLNGVADYDSVPTDPPVGAVHPLTKTELERNASRVCATILHSLNAFDSDGRYNTNVLNAAIPYHVSRPLAIQTTELPEAVVGVPYAAVKTNPLLAAGHEGTASYVFSVDPESADALPQGLTLRGNGEITGTPTAETAGTYRVTFRAADDQNRAVTKTLALTVKDIVLKTRALPDFRVGVPVRQTIEALAAGAVRYSVTGALPAGVSLDPDTGLLSGTVAPSDVGRQFNFIIRAASGDNTDALPCHMIVKDYIDIVTTPEDRITIVRGTSGVTITTSATRNLTGDTFVGALTGSLPAGMTFRASDLRINGTPTQTGVFPVTFRVELASDPSIQISKDYVIEVIEDTAPDTLKILTDTLPFGQATVPYSAHIAAAGGAGTKSFSLVPAQSSETLPTGLAISNAGVLSCRPALRESGLYKVAVRYAAGTESVVKTFLLYIGGVLTAQPAAGTRLDAEVGAPFDRAFRVTGGFSGDYTYALDTAVGDALPAGLTFVSQDDYTAAISGVPAPGTQGIYDIAIAVDETFAGSPVGTVLYYRLEVGADRNISLDGRLTIKWEQAEEEGPVYAPAFSVTAHEPISASLYVASYDAIGRLVDVKRSAVTLEAGGSARLQASVERGGAAAAYRFFIWDEDAAPLTS
jgi:beta-glucosidase